MGKTLIIAQKPSVATDISKALGGFKKQEDYYESDQYVLSSAVGHLLELIVPPGVEAVRGKWSFANLPVIPPHFDLAPIERSQARLKLLAKLIKRKDVNALINACDAGREGELIFRNIVRFANAKQPIKRLWLQSMTPTAIRDGFSRLREDQEMLPLADAAMSRSEADWLIGINGTRAMTAFNSKSGGFFKTTVGRVQTPTLAIVVERDQKIRNFVPRDFWEVIGTFDADAGKYTGKWFDEKFVRPEKDGDPELKPERFWEKERPEAIRAKCLGKPGVVTEESKPTTQLSPLLYDLTSLQREANSRFGFSASGTLKLAQTLYERHKVLTYPRTDSRALPEDYLDTVKNTMDMLRASPYAAFAQHIIAQDWVKPNKRIFNNAKVSDHFAIIPTPIAPKNLSEPEQKLYDLVTRRFLAIFYPAAEFLVTTRITRVEGEPFKSEGKVMVQAVWLAIYGREAHTDETPSLVPVQPEETVQTTNVEVIANQTRPPARFTEATLLSAMEGAGKLVEDEELREAMREKGLGTPATRSAIIEGLIHDGYVTREGRDLIATAKGMALITLLRGIGVAELCSPEMTGEWESKLKRMAKGGMKRREFMAHIKEFTREIVEKAKNFEGDSVSGNFEVLNVKCPKCGEGPFDEDYRTFKCRSCGLIVWKTMAGRLFERAEVETLLTQGKVGPLEGFRSKVGRKFNAMVKLGEDFKPQFDFGEKGIDKEQKIDTEKHEALGLCPVCQKGQVYVLEKAYACENAIASPKTCNFRVSKMILQREIPKEQLQKLITTGKTDLLPRFVSKNGRPFAAHLKLENGKVGFEFAEKKPRVKKTSARQAA